MKRFSFEKNKRIVSNKQFKAILARNLRVSNELLTLYMAENDCDYRRLGVSVSKSCGNAVVRNRLKRLLRETFRQSQDKIPPGFDYLLMISPQWPKKKDRACPELAPEGLAEGSAESKLVSAKAEAVAGRAVVQGPRASTELGRMSFVGTQPTFEQVKASFLTLVTDALRKRNQKLTP